jgi:hypothetical protein
MKGDCDFNFKVDFTIWYQGIFFAIVDTFILGNTLCIMTALVVRKLWVH